MKKKRLKTPPGYWTAIALRAAQILGPEATLKPAVAGNLAYAQARDAIDLEQPQLRLELGASMPPLELLP